MSNALAIEGRFTVINFLKRWTQTGQLTYKFSVHENALEPQRVRVTFSKPTPSAPATAAVAHLYFRLDNSLHEVLGFTVESETHFHSVEELRFDEAILDHVLRRKLHLQQQHLVRLSDEFSSARVPALVAERAREQRELDREALEEYVLERFQRKDPYNDGRVSFQETRDVLYALELPRVSRRDREILWAFVELDRDDMVDYGAFVAIGAEVLDTLIHGRPFGDSEAETKAEGHKRLIEAIECFQAIVKHRQFTTIDRLAHLLDAFRPAPPTPDPTEEEEQLDLNEADDEEASETTSRPVTPTPPSEVFVTRRQLRTTLEAPQLLLSRAEINLLMALATTTPTGQIPCDQLAELLQHVETLIFRFQTRCFADGLGSYLLQQFSNFESSKLVGSAEHLQKRIRQREIKTVVKDMKKLVLTPYQVSRLVAFCEESPTDPDHIVRYSERVPRLVEWLGKQIDLHELRDRATAVHAVHMEPFEAAVDEETVHQLVQDACEALDDQRAGVLSIRDFHASLATLSQSLNLSLEDPNDIAALTVLADPLGQGRVNYIYFQQLVYPALRWLQYEQRIARTQHQGVKRAEAKASDDDEDSSLTEK